MSDLRNVEPIVKPRTPYDEQRRIIAVGREGVWTEIHGEVFPREGLPHLLVTHPKSILAVENAPALLKWLNQVFEDNDAWNWRVTPIERKVYRQHKRNRPTQTVDAVVNYFGFHYGRGKSNYHYPIDTLTFLPGAKGATVSNRLAELVPWAIDVREFCRENGLKIGSTSGGLAGQLLRDPRFFPTPRRKIPKATNARAREHLPGNHYELLVPENTTHQNALYLDMKSAHHYAASKVTFPDPNRMYGRGHFRNPPTEVSGEPWAKHGTMKFRNIMRTHGLLLLRVEIPNHFLQTKDVFLPPFLRKPGGSALVYVYSNELPMLEFFRVPVSGIEAAWTASTCSGDLNSYASWASAQASTMDPKRKAWAKPTLLAAYGLLAARPRAREFGYRRANSGVPTTYMTAGGPLDVQALRTSRELESPVVNVILRGMIEAEVRKEVLNLATELKAHGAQVLALYADSVIVSSDSPLPLLPEPWEVKTELTRLTFFNPVSFSADQMTKLPGIPQSHVDHVLSTRRREDQRWTFRQLAAGQREPTFVFRPRLPFRRRTR